MNCPYCNRELWEQQEVCNFCGRPQPLYEGPEGYEWDANSGLYYKVQGAVRIFFDPISGGYSDEPVSDENGAEDEVAYAAPEGFFYDKESGCYKQDAVVTDKQGNRIMWTTWFDPVTGGYEQYKRLLEESAGQKSPQAGRGTKKRLTAVAAALLIVLVGAAAAYTTGWLELPFLSSVGEVGTANVTKPSEEGPTVGERAGADNDLLVDNNDESVDSTSGHRDTESFASEREEAASAANAADLPDEAPVLPNEAVAGLPVETEQNQAPESSGAVRIITELSSSPSPVGTVAAGYDGIKILRVAYEITPVYQEYGTMFFWYGDGEETQESVDDSIQFTEDFLFQGLRDDLSIKTEVLGAAQMEFEVDISVFEGFPEQLKYVYITLITFNDRFEYVAHTVLEIDITML